MTITVRFKEDVATKHGRSVNVGPDYAEEYPEVYELKCGYIYRPHGEARVDPEKLPFRLYGGRAIIADEHGERTVPACCLELVGTA